MLNVFSMLKDNSNLVDNGVMSENSFLLYPLAVLRTGALSAGKLPLNEPVCILKIGFCVISENMYLLYFLYNFLYCELVHSEEVGCLSMNMFAYTR